MELFRADSFHLQIACLDTRIVLKCWERARGKGWRSAGAV
jgi:hypothetical protein